MWHLIKYQHMMMDHEEVKRSVSYGMIVLRSCQSVLSIKRTVVVGCKMFHFKNAANNTSISTAVPD